MSIELRVAQVNIHFVSGYVVLAKFLALVFLLFKSVADTGTGQSG